MDHHKSCFVGADGRRICYLDCRQISRSHPNAKNLKTIPVQVYEVRAMKRIMQLGDPVPGISVGVTELDGERLKARGWARDRAQCFGLMNIVRDGLSEIELTAAGLDTLHAHRHLLEQRYTP